MDPLDDWEMEEKLGKIILIENVMYFCIHSKPPQGYKGEVNMNIMYCPEYEYAGQLMLRTRIMNIWIGIYQCLSIC